MEKKLILKIICLWMFLASFGTVARAKDCKAGLSLLSQELVAVMDDLAALYVENQSADPASPMSIKLHALVHAKAQALEASIPDEDLLSQAKAYIREQIAQIQIKEAAQRGENLGVERHHRSEEDKTLHPYERLKIGGLRDTGLNDAFLTPDGVLLAQINEHDILIHEIASGEFRKLRGRASNEAGKITYVEANGGELFITPSNAVPGLIKIVKIEDLLKLPEGMEWKAERSPFLFLNEENRKRMGDVISVRWPGASINYQSLFETFKVSKNGQFMASTYNVFTPKGRNEEGLIVYDHVGDRFIIMGTPPEEVIQAFEGAWNISPDGKLLAVREVNGVAIYDVGTGSRLHLIPTKTETVSFSNDSQWIICNDGINHVMIADVMREKEPKIFKVVDGVEKGEYETYPYHTSLSPDGSRLLASNENGYLWVWDVKTGAIIETTNLKGKVPVFTADHEFLMTKRFVRGSGKEVFLWKRKP